MTCPVSHSREEVSQGLFLDLTEWLFPGLTRGGGIKYRPQTQGPGTCGRAPSVSGGRQAQVSSGWGSPPLSGLTHLPLSHVKPPYHPPSGSPHKVTLGGERLAPPCRRGLFCEPLLSLGPGPVRRARERLGGGADTRPPSLPCCEARPGGALTSLVLSPLQNQG